MAVILDVRLPRHGRVGGAADDQGGSRDRRACPSSSCRCSTSGPRASSLGAAEYLVKPTSRDEVMAALARVGIVPPARRRRAAATIGALMSDTYRILVVEDNELNLKLVRDVLSYAGYRGDGGPVRASRGWSWRPSAGRDLILMDLQLPGIDGTETLRQLRASPLTQEVPVVAVTAFAMREDRERAVRCRASTDTSRSRSARVSSRRRCTASCRAATMDDEPVDPRRRRPGAEHPAARRGVEPSRLPGADRRVRRGGARRCCARSSRTSSCSTS